MSSLAEGIFFRFSAIFRPRREWQSACFREVKQPRHPASERDFGEFLIGLFR